MSISQLVDKQLVGVSLQWNTIEQEKGTQYWYMDKPQKHCAKWKKANTKDDKVYGCIFMQCPEQTDEVL